MIDVESDRLTTRRKRMVADADLSLPYFEREFARIGDSEKQSQRDRIERFILDAHESLDIDRLRLFSFPGAEWKFENQIWNSWTTTKPRFVGIERSAQVMDYSVRHMPGGSSLTWGTGRVFDRGRIGGNERKTWPMKNGEIHGWKNPNARYVNFCAEHFWELQDFDKPDIVEFRRKFQNWTCCWVDPFCQLHGRFFQSLQWLTTHFDREISKCPVAVSFAIAHDEFAAEEGEDSIESRVRAVDWILNKNPFRRFEVADSFSYRRSKRAVTMGTVLGFAIQR